MVYWFHFDSVRVTDIMDRIQIDNFASSWLVEPSEQILHDDQWECGKFKQLFVSACRSMYSITVCLEMKLHCSRLLLLLQLLSYWFCFYVLSCYHVRYCDWRSSVTIVFVNAERGSDQILVL